MTKNNEFDYTYQPLGGLKLVRKNGKFGFVDEKNKIVIPLIYDGAENFFIGLAYVKKDNKFFYIDKMGNGYESTLDYLKSCILPLNKKGISTGYKCTICEEYSSSSEFKNDLVKYEKGFDEAIKGVEDEERKKLLIKEKEKILKAIYKTCLLNETKKQVDVINSLIQ